LIGKNIGTFASIKKSVFNAIEESLVQILTPRRRVDILRDVLHAKEQGRPYAITFCGVNGVGKRYFKNHISVFDFDLVRIWRKSPFGWLKMAFE